MTLFKPILKFTFIASLFLTSYQVNAQNTLKYDSVKSSPRASIDQVAWLTGRWQGEAFGGQINEALVTDFKPVEIRLAKNSLVDRNDERRNLPLVLNIPA